VGCTAAIQYEANINSISGSVDPSWFQADLVTRKITFTPQSPFTDSKLEIKIAGMINGIASLATFN